ncbi:MAG TPA: Na/Pi symporter, partial [Clostridia bacterium]|nr:Na/Pi symporter [Clostridia bacterium]
MSVNFLLFLAGLAALLAGIWLLPQGLETLGQARVRAALTRFTATPVAGFLTGTLITALVQSSSAVTVLAVGLASKGLLSLPQGIAVVLGANVGTTVT